MSDALTGIAIDQSLQKSLNDCSQAEIDFFEREKTVKLAKKVIELWEDHKAMSWGYLYSPRRDLAVKRIAEFREFLVSGKIPRTPQEVGR